MKGYHQAAGKAGERPVQTDFTTGNITNLLVRFSLPYLISNLIQSLYNIVDIMVISRFCGSSGIAGASIGGEWTMEITFVIIGLCDGGSIMVAQYLGMKREKDVRETISTTMGIMLLLALLTMAIVIPGAPFLLRLLNTPAEAFVQTREYLTICMAGCIFIYGYNTLASLLRGMGDSRTPMYFGIISCVLNIILDLVLTGALGMDVAGAAIATVVSQAFSMICCMIWLAKKSPYFSFRPSGLKIVWSKAGTLLRLGLPGAVQSAVVGGGFLIVTSITNSLGVNAASGVALASKINNFAQMPAQSLGSAASPMIGQNTGARQYDRASRVLKKAIQTALCISAAMFILVQIFPMQLLSLFSDDAAIMAYAVPYLRVTAFDYLLVALVFPLNSLCNGSGHTMFTLLPSFASSVVFRVPVAMFCVHVLHWGIAGVGLSTPTGTLSAILLCTWFYRSGRWKKPVIRQGEEVSR